MKPSLKIEKFVGLFHQHVLKSLLILYYAHSKLLKLEFKLLNQELSHKILPLLLTKSKLKKEIMDYSKD